MISSITNKFTISDANQERLITSAKVMTTATIIAGLIVATFRAISFARSSSHLAAQSPYLGFALPWGIAGGLVAGTLINTVSTLLDYSQRFKEVYQGKDHTEFNKSLQTIFGTAVAYMVAGCLFTYTATFLAINRIRIDFA